jgi:NADH-quinone oxidoreductase subunit N
MIQMADFIPHMQIAGAEVILAVGAMLLLVLGAFTGNKSTSTISTSSVLVLIAAASYTAGMSHHIRAVLFDGALTFDLAAAFAKVVIYICAMFAILLGDRWMRRAKVVRFEYPILIVLATLGMSLMVGANSLLTLYMGVELQSLALYVLAAYARDDAKSSEAGLKYFVLGALSSGLLLYGASLVYGFSGSLRFADIAAVAGVAPSLGLTFGLVFVLAGLAFKISAAPFHMWTPDVYEGAPTPVVAFFASASKVAALALIVRFLATAYTDAVTAWSQILVVIAVLSMAIGAFGGLRQQNVKRLFAYSSIANMGYATVGLAAGGVGGVEATFMFMTLYAATALGLFACLLALSKDGKALVNIADFAGLSKTRPGVALALTMLLFSSAGIPPLAGFWGKFYVFKAAVDAGLLWLAITGVVLSVVGAFYYLRLIKTMWFDAPGKGALDRSPWEAVTVGAFSALFAAPISWFVLPWLAPMVRAAAAALF